MSDRKIPYFKMSYIGNEKKYVNEVIDSGWVTTASKAKALEEKVKNIVGAKHALAVNSCTAGLHLGLEALGVQAGDKVLVPSLTFTASAEVIRYLNAHPVLMDCDYATRNITPAILEKALDTNPDVGVVLLVHYAGQALDMHAIKKICDAKNVKILEDAAHAFPAKDKDWWVGNIGDITCFSFYANKTMTTGEGGMILTNDDALAKRMSVMRLHGIDRDVWDRFTSDKPAWEYDVIAPGYKYNMPDLNAALGLAQIEGLEEMRSGRQRVAEFYNTHLKDVAGLDLPKTYVDMKDHAWHIYSVVITPESNINRDTFIAKLSEKGIGTGVHYKPLHQLEYYKKSYDLSPDMFPESERYWQGCVSLPLFPSLTEQDCIYICDVIKDILAG